jgi:hypothetical protein
MNIMSLISFMVLVIVLSYSSIRIEPIVSPVYVERTPYKDMFSKKPGRGSSRRIVRSRRVKTVPNTRRCPISSRHL